MRSERQAWRKAVKNWEKRRETVEQGLEDSKVEAGDFVGERPSFRPSQDYINRIALHAANLRAKLAEDTLTSRKRLRVELQLHNLQEILQGIPGMEV